MKTDLYTKTMLTIIAFALVILCSRDLNWPMNAHAQDAAPAKPRGPIEVVIVNSTDKPVKTKMVDCGDDFNYALPVKLKEIDPDFGKLSVAIEEIGDNFNNRLPVSGN